MNAQDCPPEALLQEFLAGKLAPAVETELDAHISSCSHCEARLGAIQPSGLPQPPTVTIPPQETPYQFAPPVVVGELGQFGKYRIERELGRGGMGAVFLGFDTKLQRSVAIKLMATKYATNEQAKARFLREARAAARITSEHVVGIYEAEELDGVPYIAMPYLQGISLQDELERRGPLPPDEVVRLGREIAQGLADAHALGIVHRDIKPSNIWLEQTRATPKVRLLDFGLAHREEDDGTSTATGVVMGTPAYMAPEQARGEVVDARADLWSLGVVLYELATGQRPFTGRTTMALLSHIATATPAEPTTINPAVPPRLAALIMQLLDKEPAQRPATASAVRDHLERSASGIVVPVTRVRPRRKTHRVVAVALLLLLIVGVLGTMGYFWSISGTGTILLVCDDPELELTIERDGERLAEHSRRREFVLPPGTYVLSLGRPNDEYRLSTETVTIRRGEEFPVQATAPPSTAIRIDRPHQRIILNASLTELRKWLDECQQRGHIPIWFAAHVGARHQRVHAATRLNTLGHDWHAAVLDVSHLAKNWETFAGSHRLAFMCPLQRGDERQRIMLWVKDNEAYATAQGSTAILQNAIQANDRTGKQLTSLGGEVLGAEVNYVASWGNAATRASEIVLACHPDALGRIVQDKHTAGYRPRFINCFGKRTPHYQIAFERDTPLTRPATFHLLLDSRQALPELNNSLDRGNTLVAVASHQDDQGTRYSFVTERGTNPKSEPERLFAEWATSVGYTVAVRDVAQPKLVQVEQIRQLPPTPFQVVSFRMNNPAYFREADCLRLAALERLNELYLDHATVPPQSYALLRVPELRQAWLRQTTIDDENLRIFLARAPKLQILHLANTKINGDPKTFVNANPDLTHLFLDGTNITDATLPTLTRFPQLKYLGLSNTQITDQQLPTLAPLKGLQHVYLQRTRTTANGVAALQKALPTTRLDWTPPPELQVRAASYRLGASLIELTQWKQNHVDHHQFLSVNLRVNSQPPVFDAIAGASSLVSHSHFTDVAIGQENLQRETFLKQDLHVTRFFRYLHGRQERFAQLFIKQNMSPSLWTLYPADMAKVLKDYPQLGYVPMQFQNRDQMEEVLGEKWGRWDWTIEKNLTVAKLPAIVKTYRDKKWRPLFLNLDSDPGPVKAHFGFTENIHELKWDYSHRLTEAALTAEVEAKRKENLRPMNICSYVEDGNVWFLVTWIEFRPAK